MHELAKRLLKTIRKQKLLSPGDRVAVAVSGGADSVALLFLLDELRAELGIVLSVAHVNHKLRGTESDEDELFTAKLAVRLGLEFAAVSAPIDRGPGGLGGERAKYNIEAVARELRYEFFGELARRSRINKIATGHTLDDQAETVLLRIFRGTGIRGLAGIHPRLSVSQADTAPDEHKEKAKRPDKEACAKNSHESSKAFVRTRAEVVRPLLNIRRRDLRDYLRARNETWREDSSNADPTFLRNRIRQRLLPLIAEEFGDASIEHMAELAEIARAEEEYCAGAVGDPRVAASPGAALKVENLLARPLAVQRRQVRAWLDAHAPEVPISFSLSEEILELARGPAGKKVALPGGARKRSVRCSRDGLVIECAPGDIDRYEYALPVPGAVRRPGTGHPN